MIAGFLASLLALLPLPTSTHASSGVVATRAGLARSFLVDGRGLPLDGRGTSIAVIDTGVDPTHPSLRNKVVASLTAIPCIRYGGDSPFTAATSDDPTCVQRVPAGVNTDAGHGGHGTFVSGVAVGTPFVLPDGTAVGGAAPGARVVMISATTALIGIQSAFNWVLRHHDAPCGPGVSAAACPPIRVVSCSWGADSPAIVRLQDALVRAGVVVVWANGNGGGDGSAAQSNKVAQELDPTPGVIGVAGYDDLGRGTRDGAVAETSSRGDSKRPSTWPDISAPGVNIISSCRAYQPICTAIETAPPRDGPGPGDHATYFVASGTSWSAPSVAGVVALLFQARPSLSPADVDGLLKATAYKFRGGAAYRPVGGGYTSSYDKGAGLVDAYAAAVRAGARVSWWSMWLGGMR